MDFFTTDTLNVVVANLTVGPGSTWLLDRYFGTIQTSDTEEIHFDVLSGRRRISPFVSYLVEGQIVEHPGFTTNTFKPAYIKDKRVFDMNRPFKRSPGEPIGGNMTPSNRLRALIAQDMQDQLWMLNRRFEVMAGEVLTTGKSTISGEKYPTVVIDFGRAAGNTVTAAPLWSDAVNGKPLTDLENWSMSILQNVGVATHDVIMTPDAWTAFRASQQVTSQLNLYRVLQQMPTLQPGQPLGEGGQFMGTIDTFNIWVYSGWYVDPADSVEKPILPSGTVILCSPAVEGVRAFGAIRDEQAGLQSVPYFVKSWTEEDPSVRFVMMQSAPLMVPYRPNASFKAKVI